MKSIHLIPTDKPSRLGYLTKKGKEEFKDLRFFDVFMPAILDGENQNIYITNDEEINDGDWCFHSNQKSLIQIGNNEGKLMKGHIYLKKIILTTDQDLINDGVQNIENEFLEWFVNNSFHSGMIKHSLMELNDELPKTWEDFDKIVPFIEGKEYYKQKFKK